MSRILQQQRRAIESLKRKGEPIPPNLESAQLLLEDGTKLSVLGISTGVGTCADIHGVDVLVLGMAPPIDGPRIIRSTLENCQYVVLLRCLSPEERRNSPLARITPCLYAVELLAVSSVLENCIVFRKTDEIAHYVNTI